MPLFLVEFIRETHYTAKVQAKTATDAGTLVGDVIRRAELMPRERTIEDDPEVEVVDEGLGTMTVRRISGEADE